MSWRCVSGPRIVVIRVVTVVGGGESCGLDVGSVVILVVTVGGV